MRSHRNYLTVLQAMQFIYKYLIHCCCVFWKLIVKLAAVRWNRCNFKGGGQNVTYWEAQNPLPPSPCLWSQFARRVVATCTYLASAVLCLNLPWCFASGSVFLSALTCRRDLQDFIKMLLKTVFFHLFTEVDYIVFELKVHSCENCFIHNPHPSNNKELS